MWTWCSEFSLYLESILQFETKLSISICFRTKNTFIGNFDIELLAKLSLTFVHNVQYLIKKRYFDLIDKKHNRPANKLQTTKLSLSADSYQKHALINVQLESSGKLTNSLQLHFELSTTSWIKRKFPKKLLLSILEYTHYTVPLWHARQLQKSSSCFVYCIFGTYISLSSVLFATLVHCLRAYFYF